MGKKGGKEEKWRERGVVLARPTFNITSQKCIGASPKRSFSSSTLRISLERQSLKGPVSPSHNQHPCGDIHRQTKHLAWKNQADWGLSSGPRLKVRWVGLQVPLAGRDGLTVPPGGQDGESRDDGPYRSGLKLN